MFPIVLDQAGSIVAGGKAGSTQDVLRSSERTIITLIGADKRIASERWTVASL